VIAVEFEELGEEREDKREGDLGLWSASIDGDTKGNDVPNRVAAK
jgi:hypothetical protein